MVAATVTPVQHEKLFLTVPISEVSPSVYRTRSCLISKVGANPGIPVLDIFQARVRDRCTPHLSDGLALGRIPFAIIFMALLANMVAATVTPVQHEKLFLTVPMLR
jgi:hypothetical protein